MLAISAGRAFDGRTFLPGGATVIIEDGRILGVENATWQPPPDCPSVPFPDATLLPGLIDAHVHLCADSGPRALDQLGELDEAQLITIIEHSLTTQLAAGVTTVRDLGDLNYAVLQWRDGRGSTKWPTIVCSGPPITIPDGHCANMGGVVHGDREIRYALAERIERGVDIVKVMGSGGMMTPGTDVTAAQFSLDEIALMVDLAHAGGIPLTVHAHALQAIRYAVDAGAQGIEHCTGLTRSGLRIDDELVNDLAERRVEVCPTLGLLAERRPPPRLLALMAELGFSFEQRYQHIERLWRGGVRLVSGGDSGINPGKPHGILPRALQEMGTAGIPTADALVTGTSGGAEACRLGDRKGLLKKGYDADLLLVRGDLEQNLGVLDSVTAVYLAGELVEGSAPQTQP